MDKIAEKERLEKSIKDQCYEPESILDYLRRRSFDSTKCAKFLETVEQYHEVIKVDSNINRETAGYLSSFHELLLMAFLYHENLTEKTPIRQQLQHAYEASFEVMAKIYFVD